MRIDVGSNPLKILKLKIENSGDGFGLIEIVVVTALVSVAFFAFLQAGIAALKLLRAADTRLKATLLAEEGLEAVRSLRDESWTVNIAPLTNETPYYPIIENGKWKLIAMPPPLIDGQFTRFVLFSTVNRDSEDDIALTGTLDPDARRVTARVTTISSSFELVTYLTNFQKFFTRPTETKTISFEDAATDSDLTNFPSDNAGNGDPAQSFTTEASAFTLTKAELLLRRTTVAPSDIYLEVRTSPAGTVLGASQILTGATIASSAPAWVEFRFPDRVELKPVTAYTLRLRSVPSSTDAGSKSSGLIHWLYRQTNKSPYSDGDARRYVGRLSTPSDTGQLLDQYDFGFKLYALQ